MKGILASTVVFLALLIPAYSQEPVGLPKTPAGKTPGKAGESTPPSPATDALASGNKVEGLELPADQSVANDEGFVTLQAKTKGSVKWLVVAGSKVKYVPVPDNSIIVSVPPGGGVITVFAVALVEGKLTDFVRTTITVNGPASVLGATGPAPAPVAAGLHVTFVIDAKNATAEVATVMNSQTLRNAIVAKGNAFRYYDIKDPLVAQKKLDGAVQKAGSSFVVIVQRNDGVILLSQAMPKTEQEMSALLKQVGGL